MYYARLSVFHCLLFTLPLSLPLCQFEPLPSLPPIHPNAITGGGKETTTVGFVALEEDASVKEKFQTEMTEKEADKQPQQVTTKLKKESYVERHKMLLLVQELLAEIIK